MGKIVLYVVSAILLMLIIGEDARAVMYEVDLVSSSKKFYVALDYAPALSKVITFDVVGDGETSIVLPYLKNDEEDWFKAEVIDWDTQDLSVQFKNSVLKSWVGSIGYKMMGGRLEIEVGHEKFRARVSSSEGNRVGDIDTAYVFLSRLLPYYLVSAQYEKLISGMSNLTEDEILAFANGVAAQRPDLDKRICSKATITNNPKVPGVFTACRDSVDGRDFGGFGAFTRQAIMKSTWSYSGYLDPQNLGRGTRLAQAKDIVSYVKTFTQKERRILAVILGVTTGFGEVVEIPSVTATSVMVNACYDYNVPLTKKHASAYSCVGLGSTFVEIVDEHSTAKLAYRLKAGLSYSFSSGVTAFVGGFYHHIIGDSGYDRVPMRTVFFDEKTEERPVKTGKVYLSLDYIGAEFGIRLIL
ncbi:P44/Msp2 family outer membrane protein [Anaplasma phagocytophilum]|uniref:P44/Msp2 family outer membrane protein n=1 Tax=Anaplasma phagocytophilum TaxID=948 RepID=UPI00201B2F1D